MARIRTIKPEIASSVTLSSVSIPARLTFVLLITQSDDDGYVLATPRQLLGVLFPHDGNVSEGTLGGWIDELVAVDAIRRRETTAGAPVLQIVNWFKHQKIDHPSRKPGIKQVLAEEGASPAHRDALAKLSRDTRDRTLDLGPRTGDHESTPSASGCKTRTRSTVGHETWLTPCAEVWEARNGKGTFNFGQAARTLKKLVDAGHTPDAIAKHLGFYLDMRGDARGYDKPPERRGYDSWAPNIKAFADTFETWNPGGIAA
jgi:hypothetical protein